MKQKLISIITLCSALTCVAQVESADTVKVITNAKSIAVLQKNSSTIVKAETKEEGNRTNIYEFVVKERPDTITPQLDDDNWFIDIPFISIESQLDAKEHPHYKRIVTGMRNVYWGWMFNYDGKAGIENCFELGVAEFAGLAWQPWRQGPRLDIGVGLGMRRYLGAKGTIFAKAGDRLITVIPEGVDKVNHARWTVLCFHVPVMITQNFYRNFGMSVGTWVNFNTYGVTGSQWESNGIRYNEQIKGLQQQLITVDPVVSLGFTNSISIYGRWSPMHVMKTVNGPQFKSWSLGALINF